MGWVAQMGTKFQSLRVIFTIKLINDLIHNNVTLIAVIDD